MRCRICKTEERRTVYEGFGRRLCIPCLIAGIEEGTLRIYHPSCRQRWRPLGGRQPGSVTERGAADELLLRQQEELKGLLQQAERVAKLIE